MDEINLLDYVNMLKRRKWTIAASALVVMVAAAMALAIMPRTYAAKTALIFPRPATDSVTAQLAQLSNLPMLSAPMLSGQDVYVTVLNSRTLNDRVFHRLRLDEYDLTLKDLTDSVEIERPKEGGLVVTVEVPTSWLHGHVRGDQVKERSAQLAGDLANAYVGELRTYDRTSALSMSRKNRLYVEEQLQRTRVKLAQAEASLQKFQEAHPTLIPPEKSSSYADQALSISQRQTEANVALQELQGQIARARATWDAGAPRGISPEAVIDNPAISNLRGELAKLEVERATLLENYFESHPDVVALDQEIAKVRDQIDSEVSRIVSGDAGSTSPAHQELLKQLVILEVDRDGIEARRSALAGAASHLEDQLCGLPAEEMQYVRLLRELQSAETVYTTLLAEHAKALVAEGRDADNFIVLDEAIAPEKPAKPRVKLTLAAALVIGIVFGVLIATVQGGPGRK
jgi:uncharacterized protein involved in exopolysaccharide biosynthesis